MDGRFSKITSDASEFGLIVDGPHGKDTDSSSQMSPSVWASKSSKPARTPLYRDSQPKKVLEISNYRFAEPRSNSPARSVPLQQSIYENTARRLLAGDRSAIDIVLQAVKSHDAKLYGAYWRVLRGLWTHADNAHVRTLIVEATEYLRTEDEAKRTSLLVGGLLSLAVLYAPAQLVPVAMRLSTPDNSTTSFLDALISLRAVLMR